MSAFAYAKGRFSAARFQGPRLHRLRKSRAKGKLGPGAHFCDAGARSRPLTSTCPASVMRRWNRTSPERQGQFLRAIPAHSTARRLSSGHCAFPGWHARREVWHATTMQGRSPGWYAFCGRHVRWALTGCAANKPSAAKAGLSARKDFPSARFDCSRKRRKGYTAARRRIRQERSVRRNPTAQGRFPGWRAFREHMRRLGALTHP